ncbi:MAG: YbgC/FadM family acyl-CoA thioesterase [Alphaproteobacteria bacterium]|nr:YbgC/FadM family acyl-CoA thioesterase [Alphaproteobacteria bacterium]
MYYANYLKFAERARTDMLRDMGIIQSQLCNELDVLFVVRRVEMDLIKPARLDDELTICTVIEQLRAASLTMSQTIHSIEQRLTTILVEIVCVDNRFRPKKLPEVIRNKLGGSQ